MVSRRPRILAVDDEIDALEMLKISLEFYNYDVITATNGQEALDIVQNSMPDLIVLDIMMPKIDGHEVCRRIKQNFNTYHIPVLMLTARGDVEDRIQGLSVGADDYLPKPFDMRELIARVDMLLRRTRQNLQANPLTGLPGNVSIQQETEKRILSGQLFAVCLLDMDNFKAYNDRYGYSAGDRIIKLVAKIVVSAVNRFGNPGDFVGHIGGDDFFAITTPDKSITISEEIIKRFDEAIPRFYSVEDRMRGYMESTDRRGNPQRFPIMSISIAIVTNEKRRIEHHGQIATIASELKSYAKSFEGSKFVKDRRSE